MKKQGAFSKVGILMVVFLTVLFMLQSASSVRAGGCTSAQLLWYLAHPELTPSPECAPYLTSRSNTTGTEGQPPEDTREPPPSTGPVHVGPSGGTVSLGWNAVDFPPGVLPPGSTVTLTNYHPGSVPIGDAGAAFQGPGDVRMGVLIQDAIGNVIHSLPPPGMTVAFATGYSPWSQSPESQRDIQLWNGRNWVDQPTDFVWTPFLPTIVAFSTTVTNF